MYHNPIVQGNKASKNTLLWVSPSIDPEVFLEVITLTGGFATAMRIILWGGLLLALPGILIAVANFVFPGLTLKEKRAVKKGKKRHAVACMCFRCRKDK